MYVCICIIIIIIIIIIMNSYTHTNRIHPYMASQMFVFTVYFAKVLVRSLVQPLPTIHTGQFLKSPHETTREGGGNVQLVRGLGL